MVRCEVGRSEVVSPAVRPSPPYGRVRVSHDNAPPLYIELQNRDDAVVLRLSGVLLGAAARIARTAMARALASSPRQIVVDLSAVIAADSSGAVLLVAMSRHARRLGCSLRLVDVDEAVQEVLRRRGVAFLLDGGPHPEEVHAMAPNSGGSFPVGQDASAAAR